MPSHRWSRRCFRWLVRCYPREFRARFGADLEADFTQLLSRYGGRAAWRYALADLARALPMTHSHDQRARQRHHVVTLGGEHHMGSLLFDIRHGFRALVTTPVFSLVTILTLALGIGANSAIFSLVNAALLRPLGYVEPERLMMIHEIIPESKVPRFGVSPADYLDLDRYQSSFTDLGIYRTLSAELSGLGEPETIPVARTSSAVFSVLGIAATEGRTFLPQEDQSEHSVVIISDTLRRRRFASSSPIGARIVLDRRPYTVVGVMPEGFEFPKRGPQFNGQPAQAFLPLIFNPFEQQARGMFFNHSVIGRLQEGMTAEQATRDVAALSSRVMENYPARLRTSGLTLVIAATPFVDEVSGQVRRPLLILLGAVGLLLLVACANVGNLFLGRAVGREREIGVRLALGAARHRLFQMLLVESLLVAVAGGVLGLVVGQWAVRAVPAVIATSLPGVSDVALDARVVAFTLGLSVATALFFGSLPLTAGVRPALADTLRDGARAFGGPRQRHLQGGLVITSVALAFVLLVAAGLLVRSFRNLMNAPSGVGAMHAVSLEVALPQAGYAEAARIRSFYQTVSERVLTIPGVKAGAVTTDLPLRADGERRVFTPEGPDSSSGPPPSGALTWVHGDYFTTFGIPIMRGRNFSPQEQLENRLVTIVSEDLANRYWPNQDPIGKRLKWGLASSPAPWQTVIGVAGAVIDGPPGSQPVVHAYVPFSEAADVELASPIAGNLLRRMIIAVNAEVDAAALVPSVRAAIAAVDPALAVAKVTTMADVVRDGSAPQRFSTTVLTVFAAGALLLAGLGLYGVLAFSVVQRTREIGLRVALGAPRGDVVGLVVRQGMVLVGIGLAVGVAGAVAVTRVLGSLLFETGAFDPWTFAGVPVLLSIVSLGACYLPARRASRVDPTVALRAQ